VTARRADEIDLAVGERIRGRRQALGVSQKQLGRSLALTFQQIQKYESGETRVSASTLVRIAARLECSAAGLVGESDMAPVEAVVTAQLGAPGSAELLAAFAAIGDAETRRLVLEIAQKLASAGG